MMDTIKITSLSVDEKNFLTDNGISNTVAFARDYATVRDCIIEVLNPPDEDMSEDYILCRAVQQAAWFISEDIPCTCPADVDETYERCNRCAALGRRGDRKCE